MYNNENNDGDHAFHHLEAVKVYICILTKTLETVPSRARLRPPRSPPSPPFKDKAPSADEEAQTSHTERRHKSPSSSPRVPCLSSPSPLLPPRVSSSNSRPRAGRGTLGLGHLTLDPNLHSRADLILPLRFFLAVLNPSSHPRPASSNRNN